MGAIDNLYIFTPTTRSVYSCVWIIIISEVHSPIEELKTVKLQQTYLFQISCSLFFE